MAEIGMKYMGVAAPAAVPFDFAQDKLWPTAVWYFLIGPPFGTAEPGLFMNFGNDGNRSFSLAPAFRPGFETATDFLQPPSGGLLLPCGFSPGRAGGSRVCVKTREYGPQRLKPH